MITMWVAKLYFAIIIHKLYNDDKITTVIVFIIFTIDNTKYRHTKKSCQDEWFVRSCSEKRESASSVTREIDAMSFSALRQKNISQALILISIIYSSNFLYWFAGVF